MNRCIACGAVIGMGYDGKMQHVSRGTTAQRDYYIDFHSVQPDHAEIDASLRNWALWLFGTARSTTHAMWAWCKPSQPWEAAADVMLVVDPIEAMETETAVRRLPLQHREAVRWCYVYRTSPRRAAQTLGVKLDGLWLLVRDGRQMLSNREA